MKSWTTKEAQRVLYWVRQSSEDRLPLDRLAEELDRSPDAVRRFIRRALPQGQRPWREKPRWAAAEIEAACDGADPSQRSAAAVRKYLQRHCTTSADESLNEEVESLPLTVKQVASDLGLSRAAVYRLLKSGLLRRFKGRIAETSFADLLREHPETIPYSKLPREQKEWLVLNGYIDSSLTVRRPSTKGLLD